MTKPLIQAVFGERLVQAIQGRSVSVFVGGDRRYNPYGYLNGAVSVDLFAAHLIAGPITDRDSEGQLASRHFSLAVYRQHN